MCVYTDTMLCDIIDNLTNLLFVLFLMIRRPPRSTLDRSSAASDVYKRQGLDLALELGRVRFFAGSAPLPHSEELIVRLESMLGELVSKERALADELEVALDRAEAEKARAEAEKARAEEERARADRLAARLRDLGLDDESKS